MITTSGKISFDTVLLFTLSFYWLLTPPINSRQPLLLIVSFVLFCFLFAYLAVDLSSKLVEKDYNHFLKIGIIFAILTTLVLNLFFSTIYVRYKTGSVDYVHDNPIQIEEAVKFLLQGKNPYRENYFSTPLKDWHYDIGIEDYNINPALYHVIALPAHLVLSIPFYVASYSLIGWYDQRFMYLLAWLILLVLVYLIPRDLQIKLVGVILLAFNPIATIFFINGRNDVLVLAMLTAVFFLANKGRWIWSAIIMGVAVATKHTSWFVLPFLFLYHYYSLTSSSAIEKLKQTSKIVFITGMVAAIFILPFLFWDSSAFIDDVYYYPAGNLVTSYPIYGYGFSPFIYYSGIVDSRLDYFPFWIPQILISLPLLWFLVRRQKKYNTLANTLLHYAVFLLVFLYFSRFFMDNYIVYLTQVLLLAYLFALNNKPNEYGREDNKL